jgi:hypothetical protein
MDPIRPAAVAGIFYPEVAAQLSADVHRYLDAPEQAADRLPPKALIVPHAGYVYSGAIAASGYRRLAAVAATVQRVVLFGPAHRVRVRGLAAPSTLSFATPLGAVPVDRAAVAAARSLPQVCEDDAAHGLEHSLEVQLPFLQTLLPAFRVVPFAVGAATAQQVAGVMDLLWGGPETLIVVSSDLSHYHRYDEARAIDRATADSILALSPTLSERQACGAAAINGLLTVARQRGLRPELLDLRSSGDTAGDASRVVGYASFAFVARAA